MFESAIRGWIVSGVLSADGAAALVSFDVFDIQPALETRDKSCYHWNCAHWFIFMSWAVFCSIFSSFLFKLVVFTFIHTDAQVSHLPCLTMSDRTSRLSCYLSFIITAHSQTRYLRIIVPNYHFNSSEDTFDFRLAAHLNRKANRRLCILYHLNLSSLSFSHASYRT